VILAAFAAAAVLAVAFVWWERRLQHPMLPLEFFRNPRFSVASGAIAMAFFALFGSVFLLTQHLQFVLGYTPLQTGVRVLPVAVLIVAAPLAARLTERLGSKLVVVAGLLVVAGALWLLSTVELGDGYDRVAATLTLLGIGMGFTVAPATESITGSLPLAKAGVGSAMNDTTRQVGGALGVAVLGSILASGYGAAIQPTLRGMPPQVAQVAGDSIGAAATIAAKLGPQGQGLLEAARSAFLQGMGDALQVGAGVAALAALLVLLFLPARRKEEAPVREGVAEIEAARVDGQGPERAGHRSGKERRMHVITVTRRTAATPEAIWRLWADVPNRTRWDDALERITLEGPFQSGAAGIVKLRGQPERRFEVVQCEPPQAYTDRFFLPLGAKMDWAHTISEVDGEPAVTFDISVTVRHRRSSRRC
jgi:Na+/melibiose symporter-like transporter